jgi:hypothetical protein
MSVHVSSVVWRLSLGSTEKLVMLALADIANDDGEAYPSNRLLMERTGLSDRAIQKALTKLQDAGYLGREMRAGRSTIYRLLPSKPPNDVHPERRSPRTTFTDRGEPRSEAPELRSPITITKPSRNRHKNSPLARPVDVSESVWGDWLALRKAKRAVVTQTALDGIAREAAKAGVPLQEALAESCARGWIGFKADWMAPRSVGPPGKGGMTDDAIARLQAELEAEERNATA